MRCSVIDLPSSTNHLGCFNSCAMCAVSVAILPPRFPGYIYTYISLANSGNAEPVIISLPTLAIYMGCCSPVLPITSNIEAYEHLKRSGLVYLYLFGHLQINFDMGNSIPRTPKPAARNPATDETTSRAVNGGSTRNLVGASSIPNTGAASSAAARELLQ